MFATMFSEYRVRSCKLAWGCVLRKLIIVAGFAALTSACVPGGPTYTSYGYVYGYPSYGYGYGYPSYGYRYGYYHPWRYGYHRPWGYGYRYHRPGGDGYGYHRPGGYGHVYRGGYRR